MASLASPLPISFRQLHPDAILPTRAYGSPVGLDISALLVSETGRYIQAVIPPRTSRVLNTGFVFLPPVGYYLEVCSRSGLSAGTPPIFVANSPGIIDPDYTGELKVILYNGGHESCYVKHGDRIAQLIARQYLPIELVPATEVPETERGARGFGSSSPHSSD